MRSRWQRYLSLMTVISMMTVLLAACGGESPTATTAPTGGGAATATTGTSGGGAATATTAMGATDMTPTTAMAGGEMTPTTAGGAGMTPTEAGAAMGTPAGGGAAMTLPSDCSNVQLAYWNPFTGPDGPFMGKIVDAFNKDNPNIQVKMTTQSDYYVKLATSQAADQLPDVAIVHADQLATQVWNNVIRPMDDLVGS